MPQVVIDNSKGLHQKSGTGFVSSVTDHGAQSSGAVTLTVGEMVNLYQANASTTDVTVATTNATTGQIVIFANTSANSSTVNGKTVAGGTAALLVYDGSAWIELA